MFCHVVHESTQLRRVVLAGRPHCAKDSDVLDVFVQNSDQRTFFDLTAYGEVWNTRESDAEFGERHQGLYRRHSGRDGRLAISVGAGFCERPTLKLARRRIAVVQTRVQFQVSRGQRNTGTWEGGGGADD